MIIHSKMNISEILDSTSIRITFLDAAKGASMLMIIFCHCLGGGAIGSFFQFFHVPIFFFISGLFIKDNVVGGRDFEECEEIIIAFLYLGSRILRIKSFSF